MYLSELLAALARRWWLVTLGILASAGLGVGAAILVPAQQTLSASVLVLPPATTTEQYGGNALLALDQAQTATDVLARAMNSGDIVDALAPEGSTGTYTVDRDPASAGPVLAVTVTDRTAAEASALLDKVLARVPQEFAALQSTANVPDGATMAIVPLAHDVQPTKDTKSQVRAVLVAVVAGLILTTLVTALVDGLALRRRAAGDTGAREVRTAAAPSQRKATTASKREARRAGKVPSSRAPRTARSSAGRIAAGGGSSAAGGTSPASSPATGAVPTATADPIDEAVPAERWRPGPENPRQSRFARSAADRGQPEHLGPDSTVP